MNPIGAEKDDLVAMIAQFRDDRVFRAVCPRRNATQKWQAEALDAIATHDKLAVKSGHGVGKTAFQSWVVLWWLLTHYPCKAAVTANSAHQLSDVLWTEIDRWARNMPQAFKDLLDFKSDKIALKGASDSFAVAQNVETGEPREPWLVFTHLICFSVIEEASGIPNVIFETASGALSTPARRL